LIERAMVADQPNRAIARQWRVSKDAVARHKSEHLPEALTKAQDAQEAAQADDLLAQVQDLHRRTLALLKKAEDGDKLGLALAAIREARSNLELLARLEGKLREQQTINILVAPQWISLRAVIVQALAPYPDARAALAAVLSEAGDVA
jgi:hypothetical protein